MENILWFSCEPNGQYWVCIFAVCKVASYLSDHGTCYGVCAKLRRGRECLDLSISIASTLVKAYTTILEVHREDGMLPPHSRTRSLSTPPPAAAAVVAGSSVAAASTHLPTARLPPCLHLPTLSIRMPPPSRLLPPPPAEPVNSCWTNYSLARLRQKTGLCQGMPPVCCRPPFLQTSYDAKARSLWRPRAPDPVTLLRLPRPCLVAGIWSSGWVMAWLHQDSWPMLGVLARHRARCLG
jgi:hypothetical protein